MLIIKITWDNNKIWYGSINRAINRMVLPIAIFIPPFDKFKIQSMKKKNLINSIILIGVFFLASAHASAQATRSEKKAECSKVTQYTCPMHPEVVQNEPGKCPKCGMELAKKEYKPMYTCSMHPEVVQDKPGKCPKCGMDLVKMKDDQHGTTMHYPCDSTHMEHDKMMHHSCDSTQMGHDTMRNNSVTSEHDPMMH